MSDGLPLPPTYTVEDWLIALACEPVPERVAGVTRVLAAPLPADPARAKVELGNRARLVTALRLSVTDLAFP